MRVVALGGQGVAVFFVISGYSVSASYMASKGFGDYINKRFWRIAPLYYFWIVVAVLTATTNIGWQEKNHVSVDAYNLLMHITFLSSLDYRIAPTLLGVDWTLSIEMFWYFLIPPMLIWANSLKRLIALMMLSITIYAFTHVGRHVFPDSNDVFAQIVHWSPVQYILGFGLGVIAFRLREFSNGFAKFGSTALMVLLGSFFIYLWIPISIMHMLSYLYFSAVAFVLILFGSRANLYFRTVFANPIILFLGTLSYGIYLCHIILLGIMTKFFTWDNLFIKFSFVLLAAIVVSTLTYFTIEKPSLSIGKLLYINFKNNQALK
jgi:peptidoglycan/LPS O-acetylase OafA/YrhL